MTNSPYQIGGSLATEACCYVVRRADHELYEALKRGEFCYVLNSRQMGKSSLLVRTRYRLQQEGFKCTTLDMTRIGSETITPQQWYKGIVAELWRGFGLLSRVNFKSWWQEQEGISFVQILSNFIEDILLGNFPDGKIIIFIDEIDSILSLNFAVDDFFALIRFCYNQRAINSQYSRLNFAIFGVATPSDLIQDRQRTPFNIGFAVELEGFKLHEVYPLMQGLEPKVSHADVVIREILRWTNGQPFLTQKLCQFVLNSSRNTLSQVLTIPPGTEGFWVESLVRSHIIDKWESQDEPEHLRTIRNRIASQEELTGRILGVYQKILQGIEVKTDDSREQMELLLSGLVVKKNSFLEAKNLIYQEVFNLGWVEKQLANFRPYSQNLEAWITSAQKDESRLLRGQALKDALNWARGKSLSDHDYKFLAASEELDRQEVQQALELARGREMEARLQQERKTAKLQRVLLHTVTIAFLITLSLGMATWWQYHKALENEQKAKLREVEALTESSDALFSLHKRLEALIQAIKAQKQLRTLNNINSPIKSRLELVLRQAVYGVQEYNRLSGHQSSVEQVRYSPDGQWIATASGDKTVRLWKPDGTLVHTLTGPKTGVTSVGWSWDSQIVASGAEDHKIRLWSLEGRLLKAWDAHSQAIMAIEFSPDHRLIASASFDQAIKLWTRDGKLLKTLMGHQDQIRTVTFSPDGQLLVSGSKDKTIKLWNLQGQLIKSIPAHENEIMKIAFHPQGQLFASASRDRTIKLWKRDGTLIKTLAGHEEEVWAVAFSSDGEFLACVSRNKVVHLWKRNTLDNSYDPYQTFLGHQAEVSDVVFSPDGNTLASSSWDKTVKLWKTRTSLVRTLAGHESEVWSVAFSPTEPLIASSSGDKTLKIWQADGELVSTLIGHQEVVYQIAFSPDGKSLASTSFDGTVRLWQQNEPGRFLPHPVTTIKVSDYGTWGVDWSQDGKSLVVGSWDHSIKFWQPDGTLIKTFPSNATAVWDISMRPDRQQFVSSLNDSTLKLWKTDGTLLDTLKGHQDAVWAVQFSPDGTLIASGSRDQTVKLWLWNRVRQSYIDYKTLQAHRGVVMDVAFSPDSQFIASASQDRTIKLWKRDGTLLMTLIRHEDEVNGVAFSPDGKILASTSRDKMIVLWDWQKAMELDEFRYGCHWIQDYLKTNSAVDNSDRTLCN